VHDKRAIYVALAAQGWHLPQGSQMDDLDQLLTGPEYARIRRCSVRTIERERTAGTGCRYIQIGRLVRYRRRDITDHLDGHTRLSTSEPSGARS